MDLNNFKKISINYQKNIMEAIIISLISGWMVTSILYRNYNQFGELAYVASVNYIKMGVVVFFFSTMAGVIYYLNKGTAKILLFALVYLFSILSVNSNPESIWYAAGMAFITVLTLIYVRKDVMELAAKWKINGKTSLICVVVLGVLLTAFIGIVTVLRYKTFSNSTYDFGIFAQMYENMKNTGLPNTTVERPEQGLFSHFGVHFSPIFYIALPFYYLFPSAVTVQMIQAVVLGLAVIPLYYLCRQYKLSEKQSILIVAVYCLFPAIAAGCYYDIHENCFLPVIIFMLLLAIEKKNNIWMLISAVLLFMVKEDAAIYMTVIGLYLFFSRKDKKRGIVLIAGSIVCFAVAMAIVHSYGLGDLSSSRFGNLYYDESGGMSQIIITVFVNPAYAVAEAVDEEKINYFILMVLPLGSALFQKEKYSRYILMATFIMLNILPDYQYMHDIGFQYNFGTVALFMYIAIMTISDWKPEKRNKWAVTSVVITSILFVSFLLPRYWGYTERYNNDKQIYNTMETVIQTVPKNASVLTSGFIMPHLYYVEDITVITDEIKVIDDYVVVDMRPGYTEDYEKVSESLEDKYTLINEVKDGVAIYQRTK